jgi:mRNA-degrading endonuclease RelE of RelBE toxin-antitoxin system
MRIVVTPSFERAVKRLHPNQKKSLDQAVKAIATNPEIGTAKIGDLQGIYIYKFKSVNQEWLLAYRVISKKEIKLLLSGPHENFYRDLKR